MINILQKLASGVNKFECTHKGIPNVCKILKIDLETERAYVRFENPIMIEETITHEFPFANGPDEYYHETIEVESYEDWISMS
jgi:hypothetical protein